MPWHLVAVLYHIKSASMPSRKTWTDLSDTDPHLVAEHFADQDYAQAMDSRGSAKALKMALGICWLIACILLISGACNIL